MRPNSISKTWITLAAVVVFAGACSPKHADTGNNNQDAGVDVDAIIQLDAAQTDPDVDDDGDGFTENQGDCNDGQPTVYPGAPEICDDLLDNNCNGAADGQEPDVDGDGYGPCQGDCDDGDPDVSPAADEVVDGIDNNCDGIIDADIDGDGVTTADGDCDDNNADVYPGAPEICWDGIDNDCNGAIDDLEPDADGDGFGPCAGDCDDSDPNVHPNAPEVPGDGVDNNCDFLIDADIDGDGWTVANGDCDDNNWEVYPGAVENCTDGIDNNCNGLIDAADDADVDGDGQSVCGGDCDDLNPARREGYVEDPTDGVDNDCDGQIDNVVTCDCTGGINEAQAMDLCIPGITFQYGGGANTRGIGTSYGALVPQPPGAGTCRFFTIATGPAWSTTPQNGTAMGNTQNPVSVTGCMPCTGVDTPTGCCDNASDNDVAYVRMTFVVPLNVEGFSFDFIFLSSEYPEWINQGFNDTFYAVLASSALPNLQNISFDGNGSPLTVNNNFFEVPPGTVSIAGTGYEGTVGSSSGWLTTSSPLTPGETITLTFWIHDEGDEYWDSEVVIDNWQWVFTPLSGPVTIK